LTLYQNQSAFEHFDPDPATKINKNPQGPDCNPAYTVGILWYILLETHQTENSRMYFNEVTTSTYHKLVFVGMQTG
jgi:hypothetical protein